MIGYNFYHSSEGKTLTLRQSDAPRTYEGQPLPIGQNQSVGCPPPVVTEATDRGAGLAVSPAEGEGGGFAS
jgi:hypothetical protein